MKNLPFPSFWGKIVFMTSPLAGKWVVITGASSGFGAAAARAFGAEGAKLLIGARRVDRLKAVAEDAKRAGAGEVHFHKLDVSRTTSVNAFAKWAKQRISSTPHSAPRTPRFIDV